MLATRKMMVSQCRGEGQRTVRDDILVPIRQSLLQPCLGAKPLSACVACCCLLLAYHPSVPMRFHLRQLQNQQ